MKKDDRPFLVVRYGKKIWFRVSMLEVIYLALKEQNIEVSKSEIKRMYDQKGISLYISNGGTKDEFRKDINILKYLEEEK